LNDPSLSIVYDKDMTFVASWRGVGISFFCLSKYPLFARVRSFAISACRALAYFDNAETLPMPNMLDTTPWNIMKKFLENQAVLAGGMKLFDLWE